MSKKQIILPVSKYEEFSENVTFLELLQKYIIPNLQNERCHYNIGEPISDIISSKIYTDGSTTRLYPRQQVIAQGLLNAVKAGKQSLILNGGMGIGKTYITIKWSYAVIKEMLKKIKEELWYMLKGI